MTVLVCIPYWHAAPWIERCVRSVLAQTWHDLVCVVIGDGDVPPLDDIDDPRLVVHAYPVNRGAYFAQDVAIWASPFEWYAVVGADDWLDSDHIERLMEHGTDMCTGAVWAHGDGPGYCGPDNDDHATCRGRLVSKHPFEVGVYRTERYREIDAHNPAERIGQDSLTLRVQRIVAPVGATTVATYNRRFRAGSLCTSPETRKGSDARNAMRRRNRAIAARCEMIAASPPVRHDRARLTERIRRYRASLVPAPLRRELDAEAARLRERLLVVEAAA